MIDYKLIAKLCGILLGVVLLQDGRWYTITLEHHHAPIRPNIIHVTNLVGPA
jgi:hypothetical protein